VTTGTDAGQLPITTGSYASPEELDGHPVDERSDLYSLGGVLHVAATGERYPGNQNLLAARSDLPTAFADLLEKLLSGAPADRPADASGVLDVLEHVGRASNVGALIASGESDVLEFKSSLHHPYGELPDDVLRKIKTGELDKTKVIRDIQKALHHSVTKTLAAFLNSAGGTLLIGIEDSGGVLGIEEDYRHLPRGKQNQDGWLLSLRNIVNSALGDEIWGVITVSLVSHEELTVAVISCSPRSSETWHSAGRADVFYIRSSSATDALQGPRLTRYVRERWPE
jgi:serine/threonine protein kinase